MEQKTIWIIALSVGIPGVLILIGLIGLLIKFCMKRFQTRAWENIRSLPKNYESSQNSTTRQTSRRLSSEHEPLFSSTTNNNVLEVSDGHIAIPIDENDLPPSQRGAERSRQHEHTLVQIQRDRLNRLKEEEMRSRPMVAVYSGADDFKRAIDQAQKEFEDSTASASSKLKRRQEN